MRFDSNPEMVHIGTGPRKFSLAETNQLLVLIHKITEDTDRDVTKISRQLELASHFDSILAQKSKKEIDRLIDSWFRKIEKLGGTPKGIWLIDFDFGQGYYCWKYPEVKIQHWHLYDEGFLGRKALGPALIPQV